MSKIIGIDLGTTYSAVGFVRDGVPAILPNGAERIIPSMVGLTPNNALVVGTPARNQYVLYPENTVKSIKRSMGEAHGACSRCTNSTQGKSSRWPFSQAVRKRAGMTSGFLVLLQLACR